jgi:hypothetical protein
MTTATKRAPKKPIEPPVHQAHAELGPSASKRWMNCTASVQHCREHGVVRPQLDVAEEGSLAHEIFEANIIGALAAHGIKTRKRQHNPDSLLLNPAMAEKYDIDRIEQDILGVVDDCMELVRLDKHSQVWVEEKVTLGSLTDKVWGTADLVVWQPTLDVLHIIDLKYGRVWVDELENSQLAIYAIGALASLLNMRRIPTTVNLCIAQPRVSEPWRMWATPKGWLKDTFIPQLRRALSIIGTDKAEFSPSDDACRYCAGASTCPALLAEAQRVAAGAFSDLEDIDTLAEALSLLEPLEAFRRQVAEHATALLAAGHPIKGWKLVRGRSVRRWTDEKAVLAALTSAGVSEDILTRKSLLGIPAVEKLVKKLDLGYEVIQPFIEKPEGRPTLAPAADKRPAVEVGVAFDDLG